MHRADAEKYFTDLYNLIHLYKPRFYHIPTLPHDPIYLQPFFKLPLGPVPDFDDWDRSFSGNEKSAAGAVSVPDSPSYQWIVDSGASMDLVRASNVAGLNTKRIRSIALRITVGQWRHKPDHQLPNVHSRTRSTDCSCYIRRHS